MADIGKFFKQTLPGMAIAVASGVPGPIGAVAKIVGGVLGKEVKPVSDDITAAIAGATPEQIIELKKNDQDFQVTMQKMGFEHIEDMEKILADDRDSARKREQSVKDWMPKALGIGALSAFVASLIVLIFYDLPANARDTVIFLLGILSKMIADVYGYYFGSSAGSAEKNQLIGAK